MIFTSFFFPYWHFTLVAPQYPYGLHVTVYLNKIEGDVRELDILNHYIGMKKMEEAAQFERKIAFWAITLLSIATIVFLYSGRKSAVLLALPAVGFPIGFVADLFYWLYKFGHELNPNAPIKIQPFTPTLIGEGKIAQFTTYAKFGVGFWMAVLAAILMIVALFLRIGVCNACPVKERCSWICPRLPIWPAKADEFERAGLVDRAEALRKSSQT